MAGEPSFRDLFLRVQAGEEEAAQLLVRRYEPTIRRMVRVRLSQTRLRRLLDSVDICQSVLANFFVRVAAGQIELETPNQLVRLLATMARNHLTNQILKQQAERRDLRRDQQGGAGKEDLAAPGASASQVVANRELLQEVDRRLSPAERQLRDLRQQGRSWRDIARELGGSPDALRMQLSRAVDRVARELGLEETLTS